MKLLVLGGTLIVARTIVETALARPLAETLRSTLEWAHAGGVPERTAGVALAPAEIAEKREAELLRKRRTQFAA